MDSGGGEVGVGLAAAARSRSWAAFAMRPAVVSVLNLGRLEEDGIVNFGVRLCKSVGCALREERGDMCAVVLEEQYMHDG